MKTTNPWLMYVLRSWNMLNKQYLCTLQVLPQADLGYLIHVKIPTLFSSLQKMDTRNWTNFTNRDTSYRRRIFWNNTHPEPHFRVIIYRILWSSQSSPLHSPLLLKPSTVDLLSEGARTENLNVVGPAQLTQIELSSVSVVDPRGIEPLTLPCHGSMLPVYQGPGISIIAHNPAD